MGILIDIVIILILILNIISGYKKGLVNVIFNVFAFFAAIVITFILYKPISNMIIENTNIRETIKLKIIDSQIGDNTNENQENKESDNKVTKYIEDAVQNAADETKSKVKETLAENISLKAIEILTWIVVFIITRTVLLLLKFFADGVANLPIIKQLNGIGGIVYGTAKGLIIVYLILTILFFVVSANSNGEIANAIDNSSVTKFLYDNNLFAPNIVAHSSAVGARPYSPKLFFIENIISLLPV